jgi:hypothetical protein
MSAAVGSRFAFHERPGTGRRAGIPLIAARVSPLHAERFGGLSLSQEADQGADVQHSVTLIAPYRTAGRGANGMDRPAEATLSPSLTRIATPSRNELRLPYSTPDKRNDPARQASRSADCPPFCPDWKRGRHNRTVRVPRALLTGELALVDVWSRHFLSLSRSPRPPCTGWRSPWSVTVSLDRF